MPHCNAACPTSTSNIITRGQDAWLFCTGYSSEVHNITLTHMFSLSKQLCLIELRVHRRSRDTCSYELMSIQTNFEYVISHTFLYYLWIYALDYSNVKSQLTSQLSYILCN